MSAISIATRYANALLDEAQKNAKVEQIYSDIKLFDTATSDSRPLQMLLKSPIAKTEDKLAAFTSIFGGKVDDLTMNFFKMLVSKNREAYYEEITNAFYQAYNDFKNIKRVELVTATELSESLENKIIETVKSQTGATNLQVKKVVDKSILGGFILKIEDQVFDTSLQNKLNTLKREVLAN